MQAVAQLEYELGLPAWVPAPPSHRPAAPAPRPVIGFRPADRADRERVEEICSDVFQGSDILPRRFGRWIEDDEGEFTVADVDGRLAAVHRMVPAGDGVVWYEGLRVAPEFRGRGLGRTMLERAISSAVRRGYTEMRLNTGPECSRFFTAAGFTPLAEVARWDAAPASRGHLPAVVAPENSDTALGWLRQDGAFNRYPGIKPVFGRSAEGDRRNVDRLSRRGELRFAGKVPAFAGVRSASEGEPLRVTFLAGGGDSMVELLNGIRHAAHVERRDRARVMGPVDHPCAAELKASGFAMRDDFRLTVYARSLVPAATTN